MDVASTRRGPTACAVRPETAVTRRLVLLMSFVLLLSLASFAFLMSAYQARVMAEVTRMASEVGRATILHLADPGPEALPGAGKVVREERIVSRGPGEPAGNVHGF